MSASLTPLIRIVRCGFVLGLVWLAAAAGSLPVRAADDYKIQPEDVLSIRVTGEPGLSTNYRVDDRGEIVMDMVGKVRVSGLTVRQIEEKLTKELGKFLKLFEVKAFVVGENGSRVLVFGEVSRPGMIKVRQGSRILDVLTEAGGATPNADKQRVSIQRKTTGKTETVDLDEAIKDTALNLEIFAGDTITIPSRVTRSVKVDGEVGTPGMKSLDDVRTAYQAVQAARPTERADWSRIAYRKKGITIPLMIDLSGVRVGRLKDDLELQEGDQLTVLSKFAGTATVKGEVKTPGERDLNGTVQLWDFIQTAAGGFTDKADRLRVQVIRKGQEKRTFDLVAVSDGRLRADDPEMTIQPDDIIFVPRGVATLRGEVKSPGEHPVGTTKQVWDFIMMTGGGFTERADRGNVILTREGMPTPKRLNLLDIQLGNKSAEDPEYALLPGDIVTVLNDEKNRFAIVGGVRKPGTYPARQGMTLLDALTLAEGLSERASKKKFVLAPAERYDAQGNFVPVKPPAPAKGKKQNGGDDEQLAGLTVVDYKKLINGDPTQNVVVRAGDRILIPEEPPADLRRRKPSFLDNVLRLVPLAGLMMGMGGYGYGYGYGGGYGY